MPEKTALFYRRGEKCGLVLSMMVCDDVMRDQATGKQTIVGMFTDLFANEFPAMHQKMKVFAELTNGRGVTPFEIRLVNALTDEPLAAAGGTIQFSDPLQVVAMEILFANVVFPEAGEYRFQLYCCGEIQLERRIILRFPSTEQQP